MASYASGNFKQDMPPPGGYQDIYYKRIPAQRIIGYKSGFIASLILTVYSCHHYLQRRKYYGQMKADLYDHFVAIEPLVMAEKDRGFLRQLRHNRNVERDLMKDVPNWKVGTLWGVPVFANLPENALPGVSAREFYAHRNAFESSVMPFKANSTVGLEDCNDA